MDQATFSMTNGRLAAIDAAQQSNVIAALHAANQQAAASAANPTVAVSTAATDPRATAAGSNSQTIDPVSVVAPNTGASPTNLAGLLSLLPPLTLYGETGQATTDLIAPVQATSSFSALA